MCVGYSMCEMDILCVCEYSLFIGGGIGTLDTECMCWIHNICFEY